MRLGAHQSRIIIIDIRTGANEWVRRLDGYRCGETADLSSRTASPRASTPWRSPSARGLRSGWACSRPGSRSPTPRRRCPMPTPRPGPRPGPVPGAAPRRRAGPDGDRRPGPGAGPACPRRSRRRGGRRRRAAGVGRPGAHRHRRGPDRHPVALAGLRRGDARADRPAAGRHDARGAAARARGRGQPGTAWPAPGGGADRRGASRPTRTRSPTTAHRPRRTGRSCPCAARC